MPINSQTNEVSQIIDFSSNTNFITPNITINLNEISISSYPDYDEIYKNIASLYSINETELELFNGTSSAIFSLFRFLGTKLCYIYSPIDKRYKQTAQIFGYQVELINRFVDLNKEIEANSLVIFANPSNPDGSFYDIDTLLSSWMKQNCTIVIDESFLEFSMQKSSVEYIKRYNKLFIIKSFTQFYACEGVRIATLISNAQNIKNIKTEEPLEKISSFDIHYTNNILKDTQFLQISKALNITNKEYLIKVLKQFKYTNHIFDSFTNFVLVQLKTLKATNLQNLLNDHHIIIKKCSTFDFLDDDFVQLSVKSIKHIDKLKKALESI